MARPTMPTDTFSLEVTRGDRGCETKRDPKRVSHLSDEQRVAAQPRENECCEPCEQRSAQLIGIPNVGPNAERGGQYEQKRGEANESELTGNLRQVVMSIVRPPYLEQLRGRKLGR